MKWRVNCKFRVEGYRDGYIVCMLTEERFLEFSLLPTNCDGPWPFGNHELDLRHVKRKMGFCTIIPWRHLVHLDELNPYPQRQQAFVYKVKPEENTKKTRRKVAFRVIHFLNKWKESGFRCRVKFYGDSTPYADAWFDETGDWRMDALEPLQELLLPLDVVHVIHYSQLHILKSFYEGDHHDEDWSPFFHSYLEGMHALHTYCKFFPTKEEMSLQGWKFGM